MNIELVGGPKDGQIVTLLEGAWDYKIPVFTLSTSWDQEESELTSMKIGIYKPNTDADILLHRWIWQGIE